MCFVTYLPAAAIGGEVHSYCQLTPLRLFYYITFEIHS